MDIIRKDTLVITEAQYRRLLLLIAIGHMIEQNGLELNWNTYGERAACGTARCWLGWYYYLQPNYQWSLVGAECALQHTTLPYIADHFGIDTQLSDELFTEPDFLTGSIGNHRGPKAKQHLHERIAKLQQLLDDAVIQAT